MSASHPNLTKGNFPQFSSLVYEFDLLSQHFIFVPGSHILGGFPEVVTSCTLDWWHERIHPADTDAFQEALANLERSGSLSLRYRWRNAGGSYLNLQDSCVLVKAHHEEPKRAIGARSVVRPIVSSHELKRSEERFRVLVDTSPVGIMLADQSNRITYMNPALRHLLSYEDRDLEEEPLDWHDLTPAGYEEVDEKAIEQLKAKGVCWPYEKAFRSAHRDEIPVLVGAAVITRAQPSHVEVAAFVLDITRRKNTERALQESEAQFRRFIEGLPQFAWAVYPDGSVFFNDRFSRYTGMTQEEVAKDLANEAVHPDDRDLVAERWRTALDAAESFEAKFRFRRHDGVYRWHVSRGVPILDSAGKPSSWYGVTEDIHALHMINEELEERVKLRTHELTAANEEMEAFTYSVSHDLRAPLRAIMSTSQILIEDHAEELSAEVVKLLQRQSRAAHRMAALIDDLLKLSRLGRTQMHPREFSFSELAQGVAAEVAAHVNVNFEIAIMEEVTSYGDAELVRILLTNLIENAVKFRRPDMGPSVAVGRTPDGYFVKDNGMGFDTRFADRVFLPFERLVRDDEVPGTGIGLANVRRVVERHGGKVWVESAPGEGSTFWFTLGSADAVNLRTGTESHSI
jgi:PAS domain S-box-containing protein